MIQAMGSKARAAAAVLRKADAATRTAAIRAIARQIRARADSILTANAADVAKATRLVDRLGLDGARLASVAASVDHIAALPDPVGTEMARWQRPNGLDIARVRTPIGVIAMIFESRPNVAADAAAIALRSGNALILRSGADALATVLAIGEAIAAGLAEAGLPAACVQIVATPDRDAVGAMLAGLDGAIDLIIPRGGKSLVARVEAEARVPVLSHLEGICHTYVHAAADPGMARDIVLNGKMRRVSVCGATETLLIDRAALFMLPAIADALREAGCELRGDEAARAVAPMAPASEADWTAEYLAPILSVRTVDGLDDALDHIGRYGSGHTEAIVTGDDVAGERFLAECDSAIVLRNASTQFADGGEFGFGAEIGIATGRLHARGPVGPEQLTTFKYQVRGQPAGSCRA
jgi:glutamate-5-semialdehyde dehydrogenase